MNRRETISLYLRGGLPHTDDLLVWSNGNTSGSTAWAFDTTDIEEVARFRYGEQLTDEQINQRLGVGAFTTPVSSHLKNLLDAVKSSLTRAKSRRPESSRSSQAPLPRRTAIQRLT